MKQVLFKTPGRPADVAECVDLPNPVLSGEDQILVRVDAFPVNPADLLLFRGVYPRNPANGDALGNEATGVVEAVGAAVRNVAPGDRIISLRTDNWRELLLLKETELVKVAPDIVPETAAVLKVNPATALLLLRGFVDLSPGDWVVQNAANSSVGRALIAIAARLGLRTLNIVRRPEVAEELRAIGGDHMLVETDHLSEHVAEIVGDAPLKLALDAVGGRSAGRLANTLSPAGTLVVYGTMSGEPMQIDAGRVVFNDLRVRGFWLTKFLSKATGSTIDALYGNLFELARDGVFKPWISRRFPASEIKAALAHAESTMGQGKTLVSFTPTQPP